MYGLDIEEEEEVKDESSSVLDHHPNHVVIIDMHPQFGLSLTSMADESEPQR